MSGLELSLGETTLAAYLLAAARCAGFVLVSPPFNTRSMPARTRAGVALALALPLSVYVRPEAPRLDSTTMLLGMVTQVVTGAALGFVVLVALATVQAIGDLVDTVGGFQMAMGLDPMQMVQTSVMGRLHQLTGLTILFLTDAHLVVLQGLATSFQRMPTAALDTAALGRVLARDTEALLVGALEIAGPVVAVMLVADVALGLLTRAAPALNAFALGFPLKILLTLLVVGFVVARLPELVPALAEHASLTNIDLSRG